VIEFHEQHQSGPAQTSINDTLEFDEVFSLLAALANSTMSRLPGLFF
jgi:hypothetical protein